MSKNVISKDVAINEMCDFLDKYDKKKFNKLKTKLEKEKKDLNEFIEEEYELSIDAIQSGNLTFNDKKIPTFKLYNPLFQEAEDKSLVVSQVNFRSRINQADKILVMDGLDIEKQRGTYVLKLMSYISQLSLTEVKKLESEDFETINQICSVF